MLGPVAVSLRREEKESGGGGSLHSYRVIVRTTKVGWHHRGEVRAGVASLMPLPYCDPEYSRMHPLPQLRTLRGTISEDALPPGPPRGLSPRKLLEHVAPRLSPTCLRLGSASPKVPRTLLTLDEQVVSGLRLPQRSALLLGLEERGAEMGVSPWRWPPQLVMGRGRGRNIQLEEAGSQDLQHLMGL